MENIEVSGSGHLFDRIQNKLSDSNPSFKAFDVDENSLKVWVGDKTPPENAQVIIKKSNNLNYQDLLVEIKSLLDSNANLIAAGFYDVDIKPYMNSLTLMMCRDNVLRTFQNLNDFDNYFIEYLASI